MKERLAEFLESNPGTELAVQEKHCTITNPWGDETICIGVPESDDAMIAALNSLYLPARLSAVWHKDTHDLEVIYTALPPQQDLGQRTFDFTHDGRSYRCEFASGSKRLESIVRGCQFPSPPSETEYRNLQTMKFVLTMTSTNSKTADLTSFWIRDVEWDENKLIEMITHLNFYMAYYDRETPTVVLHETALGGLCDDRSCRYPFGAFPTSITSRRLSSHLLSLAGNAKRANPRLAFIFYYQILEYAAFYYLKEETYRRIKQAIMRPDVQANFDAAVQDIADALAENTPADAQKIDYILRSIPLEPVWQSIEPNLDRFCEKTVFDGGFELQPVLRKETTGSDFKLSESFSKALRELRNALVHAREPRMSVVIEPTRSNDERLRPWLPPLSVIALEVIQYLS